MTFFLIWKRAREKPHQLQANFEILSILKLSKNLNKMHAHSMPAKNQGLSRN
jgi:hypothetical protein